MPSQLPQDGALNVYDVTANYLVAKPSTKFSTRELAFVVIDYDSSTYFNDGFGSNSKFSKVVRAMQIVAEVYAVGTPANGVVTIVVAKDTTSDGDATTIAGLENAFANTIAEQLAAGGVEPDTVAIRKLSGGGFASDTLTTYNAG